MGNLRETVRSLYEQDKTTGAGSNTGTGESPDSDGSSTTDQTGDVDADGEEPSPPDEDEDDDTTAKNKTRPLRAVYGRAAVGAHSCAMCRFWDSVDCRAAKKVVNKHSSRELRQWLAAPYTRNECAVFYRDVRIDPRGIKHARNLSVD